MRDDRVIENTSMGKPFIYIASLRRTGSTLIRLLLTLPPYSLVFGEPGLHKKQINLRETDMKLLAKCGVELGDLGKETSRLNEVADFVEYFKNEIVSILKTFSQVGIKEIRHSHWKYLLESFPATRVILTGRDPRDIYLSLYYKKLARKGRPIFIGGIPITPQTLAADLKQEFHYQREIFHSAYCLKVRYEGLCTDPGVYQQIKAFTESDVPQMGSVGMFNRRNIELHGNKITNKSVCRWRSETDKRLLAEAQQTFDLMEEYCEFWGYER